MLKRFTFPLAALAALVLAAGATPRAARAGEFMHCNHKVCKDNPSGTADKCELATNGPDTHCIGTSDGSTCAWEACGGSEE